MWENGNSQWEEMGIQENLLWTKETMRAVGWDSNGYRGCYEKSTVDRVLDLGICGQRRAGLPPASSRCFPLDAALIATPRLRLTPVHSFTSAPTLRPSCPSQLHSVACPDLRLFSRCCFGRVWLTPALIVDVDAGICDLHPSFLPLRTPLVRLRFVGVPTTCRTIYVV